MQNKGMTFKEKPDIGMLGSGHANIIPSEMIARSRIRHASLSGFTFIELIVVLVVAAVLVGLAIPNFTKTRERALDKEAQTGLRLIQAAEKIYRLKNSFYYPNTGSAATSDINSMLQLDLSSSSWNYGINAVSGDFGGTANRINEPSGWDRTWSLNRDSSASPTCTGDVGACP